MLVLAGALSLLAGYSSPATASALAGCVTAAQATYRHSFNGGAGTATVTAVRPLCSGQSQKFTLLSYTASRSSFAYPQFIYDEAQAAVDARHPSVQLAVTVPRCYFQVDLIFGADVNTEVVNTDSDYGNRKLGVGSRSTGPAGDDAGGTSPCAPRPVITYRNACDGTFTATLANDASANVDAVFLIAGHRLHVAPGHSAGAERHTGTLTIRDNTFTTNIGTWEKPATGCDSSSPPVSAAPPSVPGAPAASASATAPPSAPAAVSTFDTLDPALPIPTITPSSPAAALPAAGSSLGSTLVIVLGLLLIGGGLVVLVRVIRTFRRA